MCLQLAQEGTGVTVTRVYYPPRWPKTYRPQTFPIHSKGAKR